MFTTNNAVALGSIGTKGFGFICTTHEGVEKIDIFVRQERVVEAGLTLADFCKGQIFSVDFIKTKEGRYRATKLRLVEKKKTVQPATIGQFLNAKETALNTASGEVLWRIETAEGQFVRYVVGDVENFFLRDLAGLRFKEAHLAIGVQPPVVAVNKKIKERIRRAA